MHSGAFTPKFRKNEIAEIVPKKPNAPPYTPNAPRVNSFETAVNLFAPQMHRRCNRIKVSVLRQKTMTLDVFSHKAVKNKGQKKQYFIEGHHEAIIDKKDWQLVQKLIQERFYCKNRRRKRPKIMVKGCLSGFTLIDLSWDDDDIVSIFIAPTSTESTSDTTKNIEIIEI